MPKKKVMSNSVIHSRHSFIRVDTFYSPFFVKFCVFTKKVKVDLNKLHWNSVLLEINFKEKVNIRVIHSFMNSKSQWNLLNFVENFKRRKIIGEVIHSLIKTK